MAKKEKTVVPEVVDSVEALGGKSERQCAKHEEVFRDIYSGAG